MESFREFLEPGAFLNTAWRHDNTELPTPSLDIPTRRLEGVIRAINYTKNPITITLESGVTWTVTKEQWDYLVSIGREPRRGRRASLETYLDGTIKAVNIL